MLLLLCRDVLKDLTNLSGSNEVTPKNETKIEEGECTIILSPAALGLFDLGINHAINENSPLYQELKSGMKVESSVKVATQISFSLSLPSDFLIYVFWRKWRVASILLLVLFLLCIYAFLKWSFIDCLMLFELA